MKFSRGKEMAEKYTEQTLVSLDVFIAQGGDPDVAILICDPNDKTAVLILETVDPEGWAIQKKRKIKGFSVTALPRKDLKTLMDLYCAPDDHHVEFRENLLPLVVIADNEVTVCRCMVK